MAIVAVLTCGQAAVSFGQAGALNAGAKSRQATSPAKTGKSPAKTPASKRASVVAPKRVAYKRNRTLETALRGSGQAGCGTQPSNPSVPECCASPRLYRSGKCGPRNDNVAN